MQKYLLIVMVVGVAGGLCLWLVWAIMMGFADALRGLVDNVALINQKRKAKRLAIEAAKAEALRLENEKKEQVAKAAEQALITAQRESNPAEIRGAPDFASMEKALNLLKKYKAEVDALRPTFPAKIDPAIRQATYRPIIKARPYVGDWDGLDTPIEMTPDKLQIERGDLINVVFRVAETQRRFPAEAPLITFDPPAVPKLPKLSLPEWNIEVLINQPDGSSISPNTPHMRQVYAQELSKADELGKKAAKLRDALAEQLKLAEEAYDLADIHIANEKLKAERHRQQIAQEYISCKQQYEAAWDQDTRSIREAFNAGTPDAIASRFHHALELLPLPLPPRYSWKVVYDANERILQVTHRVPTIASVIVRRPDSKRPLAKRDTDHFLRRIIPAIGLHIAQHVARNDLKDDVSIVSVNLWSRFNDKATGNPKDAYVLSLSVSKEKMLKININNADTLMALKELNGVYVFSPEEVVPIEPHIKLDKEDGRFVEGKEVLANLVQDQNLATMDWQDFEHLIREMFEKEFSRDGAEVKITRASRDRGVDAVAFDPDPIRGGKFVIQAKRYTNLVDVSAVRDLWGTVMNEGASRGILVTTSRFGRDAHGFVANKPITLIDGQNLLALLAKHGYRFRIDVEDAARLNA